MNYNFSFVKRFFLFILLQLATSPSLAVTLADLVANNELTVTVGLSHEEAITARTPITISVEVATNRWFAKGTHIKDFTLAQTIILPLSELAINGTKRINGATWATQIRELTLYPMGAGIYHIPSINVAVSVNTEKNGVVSAILSTQAIEFEVIKPTELTDIEEYVVSPSMTLHEQSNFDPEKDYQIGDAVSQSIVFTAQDVPGMMLPVLSKPSLTGISVYQKPGRIADNISRGTIKGIRTESFTYIFEQAGSYTLPEQTFYWWNSELSKLQQLVIAEKSWTVVAATKSQVFFEINGITGLGIGQSSTILYSIYLLLIVIVALVLAKHKQVIFRIYKKISHQEYRLAKQRYLTAISKQDYRLACHYLYIILDLGLNDKRGNDKTIVIKSLRCFYQGNMQQSRRIDKLLVAGFENKIENLSLSSAKKLLRINKKSPDKMALVGAKRAPIILLNPMDE
jgi:hypothetical protein